MRALLQRVTQASVSVAGQIVGQIDAGLLVLLGVAPQDQLDDAILLAEKTANIRIFADGDGRFNHSVGDIQGGILVVSQFTLYADTRKGRRPSFAHAAAPEVAAPLVEVYVAELRTLGLTVATGVFGAMMQVALVNDGPVTILLDSDTLKSPRR